MSGVQHADCGCMPVYDMGDDIAVEPEDCKYPELKQDHLKLKRGITEAKRRVLDLLDPINWPIGWDVVVRELMSTCQALEGKWRGSEEPMSTVDDVIAALPEEWNHHTRGIWTELLEAAVGYVDASDFSESPQRDRSLAFKRLRASIEAMGIGTSLQSEEARRRNDFMQEAKVKE